MISIAVKYPTIHTLVGYAMFNSYTFMYLDRT